MRFTKSSTVGGLCIRRREGQQISINHGELLIEVVEIQGKEVKLAFKAHRDIAIQRVEAKNTTDGAVKHEGNHTHEG